MSPFVPLRVRSHGSLLAGVVSPEALCERAAELGHAALGLTDIDNLYLAVRFLTAAKGAGLKPIVGAELTALAGGNRALLIPFDRRGWASLCALLTARHLDDGFDLVRAIGAGHAGLHVIAESPGLAMALLAA
ncbi:MAG TPA: PHP domain-containing protein, partial [Verrucomicrobiae bacterium]|nr:PHP domain-containing protein [Verrucomicrobiae bacterium]